MKYFCRAIIILIVGWVAGAFLSPPVQAQTFLCGDVNNDAIGPNIADLTFLVSYLFSDGNPPPVPEAADVDGQIGITVSDVTYFVSFLFRGGDDLICAFAHEDNSGGCTWPPWKAASTVMEWNHDDIRGNCIGYEPNGNDSEYMFVELVGNDLHIYHLNAYYQCCLEYAVTYTVDSFNITAVETDTGEPCDCYCYFNLESILYDLPITQPAQYFITLIGIDGDTVGVDTVTLSTNDYVNIEVVGNDLHINHVNAYYQCCLMYVIEYDINGNSITAQEADTGEQCDCYCYFNLQSILYNLPNNWYEVTVIGITGDTLAVDTVVVDFSYPLLGYDQSGCLEKSASSDSAEVEYHYARGTLTMRHGNAFFNCGAILTVHFEQAGDTLRFYEINVSSDYAYCMCYFEVLATVANIAPGNYIAEIYGEEPMILVDRRELTLGK